MTTFNKYLKTNMLMRPYTVYSLYYMYHCLSSSSVKIRCLLFGCMYARQSNLIQIQNPISFKVRKLQVVQTSENISSGISRNLQNKITIGFLPAIDMLSSPTSYKEFKKISSENNARFQKPHGHVPQPHHLALQQQ